MLLTRGHVGVTGPLRRGDGYIAEVVAHGEEPGAVYELPAQIV